MTYPFVATKQCVDLRLAEVAQVESCMVGSRRVARHKPVCWA